MERLREVCPHAYPYSPRRGFSKLGPHCFFGLTFDRTFFMGFLAWDSNGFGHGGRELGGPFLLASDQIPYRLHQFSDLHPVRAYFRRLNSKWKTKLAQRLGDLHRFATYDFYFFFYGPMEIFELFGQDDLFRTVLWEF